MPKQETLAWVFGGHQMVFGPSSEAYIDMTSGTWAPGVSKVLEDYLAPGMVAVDLGAHIGYFTLQMARAVGPNGTVYSFEPAQENYELLIRNIALNGYQNVIPVQKAVSDRQGLATFFLNPYSVAHSLRPDTFGKSEATVEVETTSLDNFFERQGWPDVHLIKMDIEGIEPVALKGMEEILTRNKEIRLIAEYVPSILEAGGEEPHQFLEALKYFGFNISNISDKDGLQPFTERMARDPQLRGELFCERSNLS